MFRKRGCLFWLFVGPLVVVLLYKLAYPTWSWREKLTVTVETPDGEKSGSAVRRFSVTYRPAILPTIGSQYFTLKGEAVVVDLGEGKYLFSLLGDERGLGWSVYESIYPDDSLRFREFYKIWVYLVGRGPKPVPHENYPLLVTFDDINDPASVKKVDPNDLAASFGPDYRLKSITLEITNGFVTNGEVEKVLGRKPSNAEVWDQISVEQRRLLSTGMWKRDR